MIKIEPEKKVLGIIVVLIIAVVLTLGILISLNERVTSKGQVTFGGQSDRVDIKSIEPETKVPNVVKTVQEKKEQAKQDQLRRPLPAEVPKAETPQDTSKQNIVILSPFQVTENYRRVTSIIYNSQCYRMIGDVRDITYQTSLVGQKYISNLLPSQDYSVFTAVIAVRLMDDKKFTVFYNEYPVTVDLTMNKITECKGRPITFEDIYAR